MASERLVDRLKAIGRHKVSLDLFMLEAELKCAVCLEICSSDEPNTLPIRPKTGCACNLVICRGCWKSHTQQLTVSNGDGGHAVFKCFNCRKEVKWTNRIGMPNTTMATAAATLIGSSSAFRQSLNLATQHAIDQSKRKQAAIAPFLSSGASASGLSSAQASSAAVARPLAAPTVPVPVVNIAFRKKHHQADQTMVPTMPESIVLQCRANTPAWEARYILATWLLYLNKEWWPCVHDHAIAGYFPNMHNWPDTPWSTANKALMSAHYRLNVGGPQGNHLRLTVQQKDSSDKVWRENMTAGDVHKALWNRSGDVVVSYEIISPNRQFEVMSPPETKIGLPARGPPGSVGFKMASVKSPEEYGKYGTQVLPVMPRMAGGAEKGKGKYTVSLPAPLAQAPPFPAHMDPQYLKPRVVAAGVGTDSATPLPSATGSADGGRASPAAFGSAAVGAAGSAAPGRRSDENTGGAAMQEGRKSLGQKSASSSSVPRADSASLSSAPSLLVAVRESEVGPRHNPLPPLLPAPRTTNGAAAGAVSPTPLRPLSQPQLIQAPVMSARVPGASVSSPPKASSSSLPSLTSMRSRPAAGLSIVAQLEPPSDVAGLASDSANTKLESPLPSLATSVQVATGGDSSSSSASPPAAGGSKAGATSAYALLAATSKASTVADLPEDSYADARASTAVRVESSSLQRAGETAAQPAELRVAERASEQLVSGQQKEVKLRSDDALAVDDASAVGCSGPRAQQARSEDKIVRSAGQTAASTANATGMAAPNGGVSARTAPISSRGSSSLLRNSLSTTAAGYSRRAKGRDTPWKKPLSAALPDWGDPQSPTASGFVFEVADVDSWRLAVQYLSALTAGQAAFDRPVGLDLESKDGESTIQAVMYIPLLLFRDVNMNGPLGGDLKELLGAAKSEADKHQRERKFISDQEQLSVTHGVPHPRWGLFLGPGKQVCFGMDAYRQMGGSVVQDGMLYHGLRVCALIPLVRGDVQAVMGEASSHTVHVMLSYSGLQGVLYQFEQAMNRVEDYAALRLLPQDVKEQRKAAKAWAEENKDSMVYPKVAMAASSRASLSSSLSAVGSLSASSSVPDLHGASAASGESAGGEQMERNIAAHGKGLKPVPSSFSSAALSSAGRNLPEEHSGALPRSAVMLARGSLGSGAKRAGVGVEDRRDHTGKKLGGSAVPALNKQAVVGSAAGSALRSSPARHEQSWEGADEEDEEDEADEDDDQVEDGGGFKMSWDDDFDLIPDRPSRKRPAKSSAPTAPRKVASPLAQPPAGDKKQKPPPVAPAAGAAAGPPPFSTASNSTSPASNAQAHRSSLGKVRRADRPSDASLPLSRPSSGKKRKASGEVPVPPLISLAEIMDAYQGAKKRVEEREAQAAAATRSLSSASKAPGKSASPGGTATDPSLLGKRSAAQAGMQPDDDSGRKAARAGLQEALESVAADPSGFQPGSGEGKKCKEAETGSSAGKDAAQPASVVKKAPYMGSTSAQSTSRVINDTWQSPAPAHSQGRGAAAPAPRPVTTTKPSPAPAPAAQSAAKPVSMSDAGQASGATRGAGVAASPPPPPVPKPTSSSSSSVPAAGAGSGSAAGPATGMFALAEAQREKLAGTVRIGEHEPPCCADVYDCLVQGLADAWCETHGPIGKEEVRQKAGVAAPSSSKNDVIDVDD